MKEDWKRFQVLEVFSPRLDSFVGRQNGTRGDLLCGEASKARLLIALQRINKIVFERQTPCNSSDANKPRRRRQHAQAKAHQVNSDGDCASCRSFLLHNLLGWQPGIDASNTTLDSNKGKVMVRNPF